MNSRSALWIVLGLPQDFARDRCGVPFAEHEKLQQVRDGIAFGQSEVRMGTRTCRVSQVEQQCRYCIGNRGTLAPQNPVAFDFDAFDVKDFAEL